MPERAKAIGDAVKDSARNPRHNLELVGALLLGEKIADAETIQNVTAILDSFKVGVDVQTMLGLAIILGARLMSWWSRRRRRTGDS